MSASFTSKLFRRRSRASSLHLFFVLLLVTLAFTKAHAQDETQTAKTESEARAASNVRGKITGRVTSDDGRPVRNATVFANAAHGSTTEHMTTTDNDGNFRLNELEPGLYTVQAFAQGYADTSYEMQPTGEPRYFRPGETVHITLARSGVITGSVVNASGEPLVAGIVRAVRTRDAEGRRIYYNQGFAAGMRPTDDRGIYRLYGLPPGTYLVFAGGSLPFFGLVNPYENDLPTYFPSSTRDTAMEVIVKSGEETSGIDIRYRGERGYTVSGTVSGAPAETTGRSMIGVTLSRRSTGVSEAHTYVMDMNKQTFSLSGVGDGEYELVAQNMSGVGGEARASIPRRITVRGADVTGIQLTLAPLASLSGRVVLEPLKESVCPKASPTALREMIVSARRDEKAEEVPQPFSFSSGGSVPDEQGDFVIRNLAEGNFRLMVRPPGEDWYVRAVTLPQSARRPAPPGSKTREAKQSGVPDSFALKMSERLTGFSINLSQGAAVVRGRLRAAEVGAALPSNLRVYLVPSERERADDYLRYAEAAVRADGSFDFKSLAPGRYWVVTRALIETELYRRAPRPLAWNDEARATLRREAETANNVLELKPCQRVTDYTLSFVAK